MRQERRRFGRVAQPFDARYRMYGQLMESWRTIRTLNVSAMGMRFQSADLLEDGAVLEVEIALPILREPLTLRARLIWSQTVASGVTENGAEFVDVTPMQAEQIDQLVKFLQKDLPPPPPS